MSLSVSLFLFTQCSAWSNYVFRTCQILLSPEHLLLSTPGPDGQNSDLIYPIRTTRARPSTFAYQTPVKGKRCIESALMSIRNSTGLSMSDCLSPRDETLQSPRSYFFLAYLREHEFRCRGVKWILGAGGGGFVLSALRCRRTTYKVQIQTCAVHALLPSLLNRPCMLD